MSDKPPNSGPPNSEQEDIIRLPNQYLVDGTGTPCIPVAEYMRIKLERNKVYVKFLTLHNELLRKEIILNYRTYDMNKKKLSVFDEINRIEELQASYFVSDHETRVTKMYSDVNSMVPDGYDELQTDIDKLRRECIKLRAQIDNFNDKIPRTVNILGIH